MFTRKATLFIVLLVLASFSNSAQTKNQENDEVPEQEKIELRQFTEKFVKRMQQTRNVEPLLREFFIRDYGEFLSFMFSSELKGKKRYKPTRSEFRSLSIPLTNLLYAYGLGVVMDENERYGEGLYRLLPKSLHRRVLEAEDLERFIEPKSRRRFLTNLSKYTTLSNDVRAHLAKKKFEQSNQYRESVSIREKDTFCNYPIDLIFSNIEEDSDNEVVGWLKRFGPDTRAYSVGTPIGISLMIVKIKGTYRAFGVWPHPFSGGASCR